MNLYGIVPPYAYHRFFRWLLQAANCVVQGSIYIGVVQKIRNTTIFSFEGWAKKNEVATKGITLAVLNSALVMTIGRLVVLLTRLQLIHRTSIAIVSIGFLLAEILFL